MKKKLPDPYAAREAAKYPNPIPSREFILELLAHRGSPLSQEELAQALDLEEETALEALGRRLRAMERDGQVVRNRRKSYGLPKKMDLLAGRVVAHRDGYGFLVPDEGGGDLFLHGRQMASLMHGDRVLVRVVGVDNRGRREGAVVEILERAVNQVVGRLAMERGVIFVMPSDKHLHRDILIPPEHLGEAKIGQIVTVAVIAQPTSHRHPIGRVVEILGEHLAPGMEIDIAIRAFDLPQDWPIEVNEIARQFGRDVPEATKQGREDLRAIPLVTIDGEDARDFDDAVWCEPVGRGWRLLVAIADVASYVPQDGPLDQEAQRRGNSVYFPERVIPMLPEVLSNGLCSLNPQVDRLCLVCELNLGQRGKVQSYRFFAGVMRSAARLTYTQVAALIAGDKELRQQYQSLTPQLEHLHKLYKALHKRRQGRGAIEFEGSETRIVFGHERKIDRIVPVVRNDAHRLIEECMILANVAAAEFLTKNHIPIVYRVHQGPDAVKLQAVRDFLRELGLELVGGQKPKPKDYAKLLEQIRERPDSHLIQSVLLRSLSQAVYTPDNKGHFGLAFDAYTHFTSPIRRYPDLLVHRAIHHILVGGKAGTFSYSEEDMKRLGEQCSHTERRADEANWDVVNWLKCEYMLDKQGEIFDGLISAVTSFGLFVELRDIFVEGLVHITNLPNDYYHFDPVHHRLTGERNHRRFRLGDPLRVRVAGVNLDERKIDFLPVAADPVKRKSRQRR